MSTVVMDSTIACLAGSNPYMKKSCTPKAPSDYLHYCRSCCLSYSSIDFTFKHIRFKNFSKFEA